MKFPVLSRSAWLALAVVLVIPLVLLWPMLRGEVPVPANTLDGIFHGSTTQLAHPDAFRDAISQAYPYHQFGAAAVQSGRLPIWNNLIFAGTPFFANGQAGLLSPLQAAWWWLPGWLSFNLSLLIQFVVAGVGMLCLGRQLGWRWPTAAAAASIFMLSAPFVLRANLVTYAATAAWLPWMGWAAARLHERLKVGRAATYALTIAATFLSGHMQIATLVFGIHVVWVAALWRQAASRRRFAFFAAAISLGLGIASIQILPTMETTQYAYRTAVRPTAEAFHLTNLFHPATANLRAAATLIDPNLLGNVRQYRGPENYIESNLYLGLFALGLVLLALAASRNRIWWFGFGSLAAIGMVWIFPGLWNLPSFLVPALALTPIWRLIIPFAFVAALMAGVGMHHWFDRRPICLSWTGLGVLTIVMLWQWHGILPFTPHQQLFEPNPVISQLRQTLQPGERVWVVDGALDQFMVAGIPVVTGYDSLYPKSYLALWQANSDVQKRNQLHVHQPDQALLAATGANVLLTRQPVPAGWTPVFSDAPWTIARRDNAAAPFHVVNQLVVSQDPAKLKQLDINRQALIDQAVSIEPTAVMAQVQLQAITAEQTQVVVTTDHDTVLVTNLQQYPGWTVSLDGKPAATRIVNATFLGATVPTGTHLVQFVYHPRSFQIGGWISLVAILILGSWWGTSLPKNKPTRA